MAKMQRKILLVDDAPEDRAIIKHYLLQDPAYDYHIWEEESGENALATYWIVRPDCLLPDYTLPDCDGLQFLTHLAEQRVVQAPAVVVLTGAGHEGVAIEAMKRGAQDYLRKGMLTTEALVRAVTNAIEKVALRRALAAQRQQTSENEARLRLALEATQMGVWVWHVPDDTVYWSPEHYGLFGMEHFDGTAAGFRRFLHPEDAERVWVTITHAIQKHVPYAAEFRIYRGDGAERWVANRGRAEYDAHGAPVRVLGIVRDITARKQAEAAVAREIRERRQVEEQYQLVTSAAHDAVYQVDAEGRIAFATPALARLTGYTLEELQGRPSLDLYLPEAAPIFLERRRGALSGEPVAPYLETDLLRSDGARIPVELAVTTFLVDGQIAERVSVARDITARKQAEEALRTSEKRFRVALKGSPVTVFQHDRQLRYTWVYNSAPGFPASDVAMLGKTDAAHLPPDEATVLMALKQQVLDTGVSRREEITLRTEAGVATYDVVMEPLRDRQGTVVGLTCAAINITARKQMEDALRASEQRLILQQHAVEQARETLEQRVQERTAELVQVNAALQTEIAIRQCTEAALRASEARYRNLFESAGDAVAIFTLDGTITEVNRAATRLLGWAREEMVGQHFRKFATPDSVALAEERTRRSLAGEKPPAATFESELVRKDGSLVEVEAHTRTLRDRDNHVVGFQGIYRDITARKEAEAALRVSEARYRSLFENAWEGIFRSTPAGRFLDVNPALVRMLGYDSAAEVLALHLPEDLYVNPTDRGQLRAQFESQGVLDGRELSWKTKEGAPIAVSVHARTILDARGAVVGYEGMVLDVTARQQAEHALEALSRRVLEVQETERRTLARELHDEMGQALMALRLNLRVAQRTPQLQPARLEDSLSIVDQLVQQVRQLSLDLRPSLLDDVGLVAALRWYIDRQAQRAGLAIHFNTEELESRLSPLLETTCFRLTQEALTNVLRHAHAHHVWVEVRQDDNELHLRIRDDGSGFDVDAVRKRASQGESLGILGMEERVRLMGGQFRLISAPAHGTELHARFSLTPPAGAAEDGK